MGACMVAIIDTVKYTGRIVGGMARYKVSFANKYNPGGILFEDTVNGGSFILYPDDIVAGLCERDSLRSR